ncbi:hypothetical protein GCM10009679_46690 [Saccharothrix algeriensis]|uniref:Uncharacterized protein n=1 Tax=Catellatospora bangladeshensis TaxID=310355 RepID=A0A8J3JPH6_9ACTN|nr:hypothetical protein Cba03nite_59050 [Catellatospora bangladeshensis]
MHGSLRAGDEWHRVWRHSTGGGAAPNGLDLPRVAPQRCMGDGSAPRVTAGRGWDKRVVACVAIRAPLKDPLGTGRRLRVRTGQNPDPVVDRHGFPWRRH